MIIFLVETFNLVDLVIIWATTGNKVFFKFPIHHFVIFKNHFEIDFTDDKLIFPSSISLLA